MTVSPALAEALRAEIRMILEADGKPFTISVARRVYDLAVAAKDLLVTASGNDVKSAIEAIEDTGGPLDSVTGPSPTPAASIVAETWGARVLRELVTLLPQLRGTSYEDPKALVHALVEARRAGMTDVAAALELRLFGHELPGEKPIAAAIEEGSFMHGFADGRAGARVVSTNEPYNFGYQKGTQGRFLNDETFVPDVECAHIAYGRVCRAMGDHGDPEVRRALFWRNYEEACAARREQLQLDRVNRLHVPGCLALNFGEDRECDRDCEKNNEFALAARASISGAKFERPPSGAENAFGPDDNASNGATP